MIARYSRGLWISIYQQLTLCFEEERTAAPSPDATLLVPVVPTVRKLGSEATPPLSRIAFEAAIISSRQRSRQPAVPLPNRPLKATLRDGMNVVDPPSSFVWYGCLRGEARGPVFC